MPIVHHDLLETQWDSSVGPRGSSLASGVCEAKGQSQHSLWMEQEMPTKLVGPAPMSGVAVIGVTETLSIPLSCTESEAMTFSGRCYKHAPTALSFREESLAEWTMAF